MPRRIELVEAQPIAPIPDAEFQVRFVLRNVSATMQRINDGGVSVCMHYAHSVKAGWPALYWGHPTPLEDLQIEPGGRVELVCESARIGWFTKSQQGIRLYLCGHFSYQDETGSSQTTEFVTGLWPGDTFFDQTFS